MELYGKWGYDGWVGARERISVGWSDATNLRLNLRAGPPGAILLISAGYDSQLAAKRRENLRENSHRPLFFFFFFFFYHYRFGSVSRPFETSNNPLAFHYGCYVIRVDLWRWSLNADLWSSAPFNSIFIIISLLFVMQILWN